MEVIAGVARATETLNGMPPDRVVVLGVNGPRWPVSWRAISCIATKKMVRLECSVKELCMGQGFQPSKMLGHALDLVCTI